MTAKQKRSMNPPRSTRTPKLLSGDVLDAQNTRRLQSGRQTLSDCTPVSLLNYFCCTSSVFDSITIRSSFSLRLPTSRDRVLVLPRITTSRYRPPRCRSRVIANWKPSIVLPSSWMTCVTRLRHNDRTVSPIGFNAGRRRFYSGCFFAHSRYMPSEWSSDSSRWLRLLGSQKYSPHASVLKYVIWP